MRARVLAVLAAEENRKWWTLFAVSFGLFMIMLDNTVVNVALPTMQRDLHVSISQLEWVVIAYALTFASKQRGQAIGIWAGVSALALAIGPLAGGLITQHLNWNWIFFINVPVGALAIVVSQLVIRESRDTSVEQSIDLPGLATSVSF